MIYLVRVFKDNAVRNTQDLESDFAQPRITPGIIALLQGM